MLVFNSLCIDWKCIIVTERHWIKNFGNANDFLKATVFIICFHGLFFDTRFPLVKSKTIVQLNLSLYQMHIHVCICTPKYSPFIRKIFGTYDDLYFKLSTFVLQRKLHSSWKFCTNISNNSKPEEGSEQEIFMKMIQILTF